MRLRASLGLGEDVGIPAFGHLARGRIDGQSVVVAQETARASVDGILMDSRGPFSGQIDHRRRRCGLGESLCADQHCRGKQPRPGNPR